ncbi:hypothetical protein ACFW7K_31870 [Streptomyces sp. NPDC058735]|uniref:hypothetical protein n=1 Tax=Streptomyces sp. NPDC058735 TaxID=3346616 RepID=UPI0036CA8465
MPVDDDVFYSTDNPAGVPYSFLGTATALASTRDQRTATTYERSPRFTVTFTRRPGFTAWTSDGTIAQTLVGLRVDIAPR